MEEINPLEIIKLPEKSVQNRRGRPLVAKVVKFTPQPKSIVSRLLRRVRIRKEDFDSVKEISLHNIHNNSNNSGLENDTNYRRKSFPEVPKETNTNENFQEGFTLDLTTLENDSIDNDSYKDNWMTDDGEENNSQTVTWLGVGTLQNNNCAGEPKPCEIACYLCPHKSGSNKEHRRHLSTHRNQPYTCNFPNCTYTCKLSCNLIKHKRIHTSEKPYLCDQCTFRSNFANSLKVHKRIHTSERPYGCQHCSYRCNSSSNLKKHCQHKHRNMC